MENGNLKIIAGAVDKTGNEKILKCCNCFGASWWTTLNFQLEDKMKTCEKQIPRANFLLCVEQE